MMMRSVKSWRQRKPPLVLPKNVYGIGISWDSLMVDKGVDLDLQAVIVDTKGHIVDAVYYNNLVALNGALAHSGDESNGAKEGLDESMWLNISKLPANVSLIIFVIAAYASGSLADAENGKVVLCETNTWNRVAEMDIERCQSNADVVAMIKHCKDGSWAFFEIDEPAECGSHFLDILEPNIGDMIRKEIPGAPSHQRLAFQMDKGAVMDLPSSTSLKRLCFGIGGMLPPGSTKTVDIDIAAHFYNKKGSSIGVTHDYDSSMFGVEHGGDNYAGSGYGDDEIITMDLAAIPKKVSQIFVVMSIANGTFEDVQKVYARAVDQNANELVCYHVDAGHKEVGLAIARLFSQPGGRWGFQAIGHFFFAGDQQKILRHIFNQDPSSQKHLSKRQKTMVNLNMPELLEEEDSEIEKDEKDPEKRVTVTGDDKPIPTLARGSTKFTLAPKGIVDGSRLRDSSSQGEGSRSIYGSGIFGNFGSEKKSFGGSEKKSYLSYGSRSSGTSGRMFLVGKHPEASHTLFEHPEYDTDPTEVVIRSKGLSLSRGNESFKRMKERIAVSQMVDSGTMAIVSEGNEADGTEKNMCSKCAAWRCAG